MTNPYAPPRAAVRDVIDLASPFEHADRGSRLGAAILDGFIFFGMVFTPMFVGSVLGASTRDAGAISGDGAALVIAGALTLVGFGAWCWLTLRYVRRNGQSIGKKLVNIKVVRTDGSAVSLSRFFWLRNVVNSLIGFVPLYGFIDVLFIFGESRQCLHDKIADTMVIKA
jgi:uncharacterized RDD family membrane protein YckC